MRGLEHSSILTFSALIWTAAVHAEPVEIPFRLHEHLIVVEGTANGIGDLNLVIDTGATVTVISDRLCRRLRLRTGKASSISWGRTADVQSGKLENLTIGGLSFRGVEVRVGNVEVAEGLRIDLLIGLDLLKRAPVTIDYEDRVLTFGHTPELSGQAPFYPNLPFLPIRLTVQGRPLTLILDTGAPYLILFKGGKVERLDLVRTRKRQRIAHVAGNRTLRQVLVRGAFLAGSNLETLTAYLMTTQSPLYGGADGIFSPSSVGLARIHLDFKTSRIGWEF